MTRSQPQVRTREPAAPGVIALGPGEGRAIPGPEGVQIKALGRETGGAPGVLETSTPAGFDAPRHIHHTADEMFYVLGGRFQFLLGDGVLEAGAGSFVFVPRGTVHAPKVVGPEPGRTLIVFTPGGQEEAFEEFAALAAQSNGAPPDEAEMQALAASYQSEFVGPPLGST